MSLISTLWKCTFSPRLHKFYEVSWVGRLIDKPYEAKRLEKWSDRVVFMFVTAWSFTIYAIPLIVIVLFRRGSPMTDAYTLSQFVTGASIILVTSLMARGYSRAHNPIYLKFIKVLDDARSCYNFDTKQELSKYDFEFWAWPIDFDATISEKSKYKKKLTLQNLDSSSRTNLRRRDSILAVPCKVLSYAIANTVALKLIYPGSISLVNWIMSFILLEGRTDLIKIGAERFKLLTSDNNEIDTIFLDRRHKAANGAILIITCEGNCGFYEIGIITTPLNKGYSVLGWNHPGFGGSTGLPFPDQEENAIDCVMKFAINKLGFAENKIILNGWSIGGYTASWAAMNYPYIHSLLLDATFDDVLPLALAKTPTSVEPLVRNVIRNHFNLNIAAQVNRFDGRVLIIRRTDDEMICVPDNSLAGNRGNKLLEKLLARRYPNLFTDSADSYMTLSNYLSAPTYAGRSKRRLIMQDIGVDKEHCTKLIAEDILENNGIVKYPSNLGRNCNFETKQQLLIYLATLYMDEQISKHSTLLTTELFRSGWDPMSTIKYDEE